MNADLSETFKDGEGGGEINPHFVIVIENDLLSYLYSSLSVVSQEIDIDKKNFNK